MKTKEKLPNWDLGSLYKNNKDPKIKSDLEYLKQEIASFSKSFKGKISQISANKFYEAIKKYETTNEVMGRLSSYAYLQYSADMSSDEGSLFYQNISENINDLSSNLLFFCLEINALDDKDISKKLYKDFSNFRTLLFENIVKNFGENRIVDNFNLKIKNGDFVSFLGPSGCGKTTCLRMLAGLEENSSGKIYLGDKLISDPQNGIFTPPEKRKIGMVFQSYAVWPHMTIFDNIAYPLKIAKVDKFEIEKEPAIKYSSEIGNPPLVVVVQGGKNVININIVW